MKKSKLLLIQRREGEQVKRYAHIGTGNFHEGTARVYADEGLMTSDPRIANEVAKALDLVHVEIGSIINEILDKDKKPSEDAKKIGDESKRLREENKKLGD